MGLKPSLQLESQPYLATVHVLLWSVATKAAGGRSDFLMTSPIYFAHLPLSLYISQHPKLHIVAKLLQHVPGSRRRGLPSSRCPSPLPSPQDSLLPGATFGASQGAGGAQWLGSTGRKGKGKRKARMCHPLLMALRSACVKAIRHVAAAKVSLFPSHGWLIDEPFILPHNSEKHFLKTRKCNWMIMGFEGM